MSEFVSVERINSLKSGIESKTGETYADLTAGVQALADGYGVGSAPVLTDLEITKNGEYTPPDGVDGFGKVTANVAGSGGTDWLQTATHLTNFFDGATDLPETVVIDAPNVVDAVYMFRGAKGFKHVILNLGTLNNLDYIFNLQYVGAVDRILETVEINANLDNVTHAYQAFYMASNLREIRGTPLPPIQLSSKNYMNLINDLSALEEVRFVPNKCSNDIYLPNPTKHSDETLISIANSIQTGTANTITLNAIPKARCEEIFGIVSQKTADDGTVYDFFTSDSAGTVTLTEFITNTKGWTLA